MINKWVLPILIFGIITAILIGRFDSDAKDDKKNKYLEERDYVKEIHIHAEDNDIFQFYFVVVDLSDYKGNYKDNLDIETCIVEADDLETAINLYVENSGRYLDVGHVNEIYIYKSCFDMGNRFDKLIKNMGEVNELSKQSVVFMEMSDEEIIDYKLYELIKDRYNREHFI